MMWPGRKNRNLPICCGKNKDSIIRHHLTMGKCNEEGGGALKGGLGSSQPRSVKAPPNPLFLHLIPSNDIHTPELAWLRAELPWLPHCTRVKAAGCLLKNG